MSEFSSETAVRMKLFLNLVVSVQTLLQRLPEDRRANSPCAGW